MELRGLWIIARRRWWLIALPALVALVYAGYGALRSPPGGGYATSLRFTAAVPPSNPEATYEDSQYYTWLASEYVVNGLTDWVKTSSFAEEVSAELKRGGVDIPAPALQPSFSADNARSVMVLYLSWGDAAQLEAIAQAAVTVLQERSGDYFPQIKAGALAVIPLDDPVIAPVPPPLSARLNPILRFGLGLAAGIALAFLADYLDPTLRTRAEVEAAGLAVLAEIPSYRVRPN
jgi:capsular polysaccharide biosynthesis protein